MIPRAQHDRMANAIRALAMDAVETAKSGHPGLPMGAADLATVLFSRFLQFDPADPAWPDRDRFVLSAGHGSMLIYAVLHLLGVEAITIEEIKRFRQLGSITPGHPEHGHTPGIETTTGPLGHRHGGLRGECALQGPLSPVRHHRPGGRRGGAEQARPLRRGTRIAGCDFPIVRPGPI